MKLKLLAATVLAAMPAITLATGSIGLTSYGSSYLEIPCWPLSIPVTVNLSITTPFGTWDAAIMSNKPGYYLDNRTANSPFSSYWNLDFGAWNTSHQSLDNQAISIGFMKPSAGDITFTGVAETFTLTGPALIGDGPLILTLVAPDSSGLFYKGAADPYPQNFSTIGCLVIDFPEPASLLMLGLGSFLLRHRRRFPAYP